MPTPAPASPSSSRLRLLCTLFLLVGTCLLYLQTVDFSFLAFDDDLNIYGNPLLGTPSWKDLGWMFSGKGYMLRYLPLSWLLWDLVHVVSGLQAWGYHLANLCLQLGSTWLLFRFLLRLLELRAEGPHDNAHWRTAAACLATAFWSWHPLRVELVAWASGLLYLHAAFWMLVAANCHLEALAQRMKTGRWGFWLYLGFLAYIASLLSYPVAIGYPVALLALTWYLSDARDLKGHLRHVQGWLISGLLSLGFSVLAVVIRIVRADSDRQAADIGHFPLLHRFIQSAYVLTHSLWKTLVPQALTPIPTDLLKIDPTQTRFLLSYLLLAGLCLLLWVFRRQRGLWLLSLAFMGLQIPFLGFMEHPYFPCDRYSYFPGLVLALGLTLALLKLTTARWQLACLTLLAVLLLTATRLNDRQQELWRNDDSFYPAVQERGEDKHFFESYMDRYHNVIRIRANPSNPQEPIPTIFLRYASGAASQKRYVDAREWLLVSRHYAPYFAKSRYNLALLMLPEGRCREAAAEYLWLKAHPSDVSGPQLLTLLFKIHEAATIVGDLSLKRATELELPRAKEAAARDSIALP